MLCPSAGATPASSPGSSGNYTVLAGSTVTNTGTTRVDGNVGLYPGTSLTGFSTVTVTGDTDDDNANAQNGQAILTAAINDARGRSSTSIPAELGGTSPVPGVYSTPSGTFSISSLPLTLDANGDPNAVWIFQATTLTTVTGNVVLAGSANGCNVFWEVSSGATGATLGTGTTFYGNILASTSITLDAGATIPEGRVLASTGAVALDDNTIGGCSCP